MHPQGRVPEDEHGHRPQFFIPTPHLGNSLVHLHGSRKPVSLHDVGDAFREEMVVQAADDVERPQELALLTTVRVCGVHNSDVPLVRGSFLHFLHDIPTVRPAYKPHRGRSPNKIPSPGTSGHARKGPNILWHRSGASVSRRTSATIQDVGIGVHLPSIPKSHYVPLESPR